MNGGEDERKSNELEKKINKKAENYITYKNEKMKNDDEADPFTG